MNTTQAIFYGAGENARINLKKWLERGLVPICFADKNPAKIGTTFEGHDVISLEDALLKYPDAPIYVTLASRYLLSATNYLIEKGIGKERIKYFEEVEYRKGCWQLEEYVRLIPDIVPCRHWKFGENNGVPLTGDWERDFRNYEKKIAALRDKLRNDEPCECTGCAELEYGLWLKELKPRSLTLAVDIKGERCNCKCVYCDLTHTGSIVRGGEFTAMEILNGLAPFFPEGTQLFYAPAELTVSPYKREIYEFMRQHKWEFLLLSTSAILFDSELAEFLKDGKKVNCSLDCGTRETYLKIKGVDCFDRVIDNLRKYRDVGCKIELKYIFVTGINDNTNDVLHFAEIARELADSIDVTVDMNKFNEPISDSVWDALELCVREIKKLNLPLRTHSAHMGLEDFERLQKMIKE